MSVILFISLIDFILSSLAWVYYSHAFSFLRSTPFIILYVALMLNTVGSRMLSASLPLPLLKLSAWLSGYWIAFLYYSLLLMVLHGIAAYFIVQAAVYAVCRCGSSIFSYFYCLGQLAGVQPGGAYGNRCQCEAAAGGAV